MADFVQTVCFVIAFLALAYQWRMVGRMEKRNRALREELADAREYAAALTAWVGPDTLRTCQVCGHWIANDQIAVLRRTAGEVAIGHAICFPPMESD